MRMLSFAKRCIKEILRDPLNILFGVGFPVILLILLTTIQANVPVELFKIETLTPGVIVFGLSFLTLFSSTIVAKDRENAFLHRLYTTPLKPIDYILGYMLPIIPIALAQSLICFLVAICLKLPITINILYTFLMIIPISIIYITLGLLCGSLFNVKQVGGICGALLTNLSAWLSGVWFDISYVGNAFETIANILPFVHFVELQRSLMIGEFSNLLVHLYPIIIYIFITTIGAILLFLRQMKRQ